MIKELNTVEYTYCYDKIEEENICQHYCTKMYEGLDHF